MASDAHFAAQLAAAAAVIDESFVRWRPSEMALSFNGGKDCTVLLHMLGTSGRLDGLRVVFFDTEVGFPEITSFMQDMEVLYGFKCQSLGGFREGLAELVADGIKAVFLGTRRGDPHGGTLDVFSPTTAGWPPMMRVNPILEWHYADVWTYLRRNALPYCSLYDVGYTSLGSVESTVPNPKLLISGPDSTSATPTYLAAWQLEDGEYERDGRITTKK